MSSHPRAKIISWTGCLLGFGILVAIYLLVVRVEESAYETSKGQWTTYTGDNSPLKYEQVTVLLADKKGNLWIGTEWGLYKIDPNGTWEIFTTENSDLLDDTVRALAVDRSGNLWVAGAGLHVVYPNGQWTTIHPGRDWEAIHALAFDSQGRTWIGTFGGLIALDASGDERVYTKENSGLVNNSVTALAVDQQDRVWIGTFGYGVNVLDPQGHWTTYREGGQHLRLDKELVHHV